MKELARRATRMVVSERPTSQRVAPANIPVPPTTSDTFPQLMAKGFAASADARKGSKAAVARDRKADIEPTCQAADLPTFH
jgi:hypothetical protein